MNETKAVACRCGREPERSASRRGYDYSLSCRCGADEINFVVRSKHKEKCMDNWNSLILRAPYKHYVQKLDSPETDVRLPMPTEYYDLCPLRRYVRATGGHCSGGGGPC